MNQTIRDWRETPIEVGSIVVYPTASSSRITMNEAIVAEIDFTTPALLVRKTIEHTLRTRQSFSSDSIRLQKITRFDRVTVVKSPDPGLCNWHGCVAPAGHDNAALSGFEYWPAHSFERRTPL